MADLAKVKRNIKKMVDQGAPEEDIDTYLKTEGVSPEQLRGTEKDDYGAGPVTGPERFVRRIADPLTFGFNDKAAAAVDAVRNQVLPIDEEVAGKSFGETYDTRLKMHRRRTAAALESPEDAAQGVSDVAASTLGLGGAVAADPLAAVGAAGRTGLAALRSVYEAGVPAAQAGLEALRTGGELARHGFTYGSLSGYGHSDEGGVGTVGNMLEGGAEGVKFALGLANAFRALGLGHEAIVNRNPEKTQGRAARADEMREVAGSEFGPAISGTGTAQKTAAGLGNSFIGGPVRDRAGKVISGVEERARRTLDEQTGRRSSDELGRETQDFLRRQLTERSRPAEEVKAMTPEQLQDITGLPLPERYNPPPPKVASVTPRQVQRITPDEYLDEVRRGVPEAPLSAVEPRYAQIARENVKADRGVLSELDAARREQQVLAERLQQSIEPEMAAASQTYAADPFFTSPGFPKWEPFIAEHKAVGNEVGSRSSRPIIDPAARTRAYDAALARFEREVGGPQRAAEIMKKYDDLRFLNDAKNKTTARLAELGDELPRIEASASSSQQRNFERTVNEGRRTAQQVADEEARAAQALETQRAQELAVQREAPTAVQKAAERTRAAENRASRDASAETVRLQAEADARHAADLAKRKTRVKQDFRLGQNPDETYVTEADAAYEMGRRHTPVAQRNPLGHRGGPHTATTRLLDSVAQEARGGGQLPGYKNGQLFDETGAIRQDVLDHLRPRLGSDVADRLAYLSERRAAPGRQFAPAIQGLHDMRTAIGRAMRDAESVRPPGETKGPDEALLARLHKAFDEDITNFRNAGPGGKTATALRQQQDANYESLLDDLRRPLGKLFGNKVNKVTPVQALDRLADAARSGDLGVLRAYMRVMTDKGDPVRGAATVVAHMADGAKDLGSFLKGLDEIKPESRDILFHGSRGAAYRRELEKLERVGKMMKPYEKMARASGGLDLSGMVSQATRPSNLLAAAGLYFHFWPSMVAIGGSAAMARFMASPRYVRWLTELPAVTKNGPRSPAALRHLATLASIARNDPDGGEEILAAASELFLPTKAMAMSAQDELDMLDGKVPETSAERPPEEPYGEQDNEQYEISPDDEGPEMDRPPAWRRAGRHRYQLREMHGR